MSWLLTELMHLTGFLKLYGFSFFNQTNTAINIIVSHHFAYYLCIILVQVLSPGVKDNDNPQVLNFFSIK